MSVERQNKGVMKVRENLKNRDINTVFFKKPRMRD